MSEEIATPSDKHSKATAGGVGAGGGTLLMVFASTFPDGHKLKPWLLWASPSVSVFLGGLWLWLQVKIANYMRDRDVRSELREAEKTLETALNNPKTSEAHKARIREQLEKLEQLRVDRHMERIKSLKIATEEEIIERNKGV